MDSKELRNLQEAYMEVVENQQQLDEADSLAAMQARREKRLAAQRKREGTTATGRDFGRDDSLSAEQQKKRRDAEYKAGTKKEEVSVYDIVLSHLIDEGYADTVESAEGIMANMSEEWREDIMEISQKTATRAYAASSTGEFEGQDSSRDVKRTDNLRKHIQRKFGDKAAKHADRAAHSMTFGRKSKFMKMPPKP